VSTTAQGIVSFWNASSLPGLTDDGKLWYGEAPNQPITPYAVLIMVSEPETARTTAQTESVLFEGMYQINCMADTLTAAEAMAKTVWTTFNGAQLIRDGKPVMHCLAGERRSMLGHELGIDSKDCWISYVMIEVLFMQ
jgi:hypothetical protein